MSSCTAVDSYGSLGLDEIEFDTKPDATGMGRIKVGSRLFPLPAEVVSRLEDAWVNQVSPWDD